MISPHDGKAPMRPMKDGTINPLKRQNQRRSVSGPAEYVDASTFGNVTSLDTHARPSSETTLHPINNQTSTTNHATSSQSTHHFPMNTPMNTIHDQGPSHVSQSNSLSAALLPPESRRRDPDHSTLKGASAGLPLTSTHSTESTSQIPMASGNPSNENTPSYIQPSTREFHSKTPNPSSPRQSMTQAPSLGGVQPTSTSISLPRSTSLGPSNPTDSGNQTNPIPATTTLSPIQASTDKRPSPITTSSSNHTTSTPITVSPVPKFSPANII